MKSILKSIIFASILLSLLSAQSSVTGTVTDDSGNALAGANIIVEGTSIGAAAGSDGTYVINVPAGTVGGQTVTLTASYIGHQSQSCLLYTSPSPRDS